MSVLYKSRIVDIIKFLIGICREYILIKNVSFEPVFVYLIKEWDILRPDAQGTKINLARSAKMQFIFSQP